jgi:site-specific DNA recombinase
MRFAIYARRSTDEHQAASLDTQIEEAIRFAAARGWEHVVTFTEDAVSRAEFKKRPALIAMLNAASRRDFDAVVMRDETRIGGDLYRTGMIIQDLNDQRVRLFYYATGEEVRFEGPTDKIIQAVKLYGSELERIKIAERTRESLEVRARRGVNVGGRVYGYDNVEVREGDRRVRVEYAINESEAAIVREIFERAAKGEGVRGIACELNSRGVPSPRAGRRGTGSWSPSVVWAMLRRERYRGTLVWGKVGSEYRGGTRVEIDKPASTWISADRPELAIVSEELWRRVTEAPQRRASQIGQSSGRTRHLLSGFARCSECGGPMQVSTRRQGREPIPVYQCGWARDRGDTVCRNRLKRPTDEINGAIVGWILDRVLSDDVLDAILATMKRVHVSEVATPASPLAPIEAELRKVNAEIQRLATAIATTDTAPDALTKALVERERRARDLRERLSVTQAAPKPVVKRWIEIERETREMAAKLRATFDANPLEARAVVGSLLRGPIKCTPVEIDGARRYRLQGEFVFPPATDSHTFASPGGPERDERYVIALDLTAGIARAA